MVTSIVLYAALNQGFWTYFLVLPIFSVSLAWFYPRAGGVCMIFLYIIVMPLLVGTDRLRETEIVPAYILVPLYLASGISPIVVPWWIGRRQPDRNMSSI
jgi:hypothetical protein